MDVNYVDTFVTLVVVLSIICTILLMLHCCELTLNLKEEIQIKTKSHRMDFFYTTAFKTLQENMVFLTFQNQSVDSNNMYFFEIYGNVFYISVWV